MILHTWLTFVSVSLVLVLIPGPTVLMVIGDALANKNKQPWSTVLGVGAGDTLAMTISLAGAGALLQTSAAAFTVLKTLGGLYLIYLGVRAILSASKPAQESAIENNSRPALRTALSRFSRACAVTALNPKSVLFFVAFVPQFISTQGSFVHQSSILLVTFVAIGMVNVAMYAALAGLVGRKLSSSSAQRKINYAAGGALITAGALTLALKQR